MSQLLLTPDEMMAQWRLRAFPEEVNADCTATRYDGIDLDAHLRARMQAWYDNLLLTAPAHMLAPVDIAADVALSQLPDGSGWFRLPDDAVRLTYLMMPGWLAPALIVDATLPGASLQLSGRQRSDYRAPVAVVDGRLVRVFSPAKPSLFDDADPLRPTSCLVVVDAPDVYRLDSRALATIQMIV